MKVNVILTMALLALGVTVNAQEKRGRARDFGIFTGILSPGKYNAITDVAGVRVGHTTLIKGDSVRTGVTAIIPHGGNIFQDKVPAAIYVVTVLASPWGCHKSKS